MMAIATDEHELLQQMRLSLGEIRLALAERRLRALEPDEVKTLPFTVDALTDTGEFVGLASVYGVRDEVGDVVEPTAFLTSLQQSNTVPILWNHEPGEVLGIGELEHTPRGLRVRGKLNLAVGRAKEIYALLKQGAARGLSIGYTTLRSTWQGATRHLHDVRLFEVSLTPFPAQPLAVVEAVKSSEAVAASISDEAAAAALLVGLRDMREYLEWARVCRR